jgi:enamine deaminase RidA (YjgF/YER057c/UK114 family)
LPPFDPESGEIEPQPFECQCELVLEQLKHCLEAGGLSLPGSARVDHHADRLDDDWGVADHDVVSGARQ